VPPYSDEEIAAILFDYRVKGLVVAELTNAEREYITQFSGRRAKEVVNLAALL
jgi:hypothetical protein